MMMMMMMPVMKQWIVALAQPTRVLAKLFMIKGYMLTEAVDRSLLAALGDPPKEGRSRRMGFRSWHRKLSAFEEGAQGQRIQGTSKIQGLDFEGGEAFGYHSFFGLFRELCWFFLPKHCMLQNMLLCMSVCLSVCLSVWSVCLH